ncbi:hypothetical protein D3C77_226870 [compost metagenome]
MQHQLSESYPGLFSPAQGSDFLLNVIPGKQEIAKHCANSRFFHMRKGAPYFLQYRIARVQMSLFLVVIPDFHFSSPGDGARGRLKIAGQNLEQGRFADSIWPDQGYGLAPLQIKGHVAKQRFFSGGKRERKPVYLQHILACHVFCLERKDCPFKITGRPIHNLHALQSFAAALRTLGRGSANDVSLDKRFHPGDFILLLLVHFHLAFVFGSL